MLENDDGLSKAATAVHDQLDMLLDAEYQDKPCYNDSLIEVPPVTILEAIRAPYFEFLYPDMPLWTRQGFDRLVEVCHASTGNEAVDRAGIVCANNVALLTLTANSLRLMSKQYRKPRPLTPIEKQGLSSMELNLLTTFLVNAKHALSRIEQLLWPSLANVQAFLSLVRL